MSKSVAKNNDFIGFSCLIKVKVKYLTDSFLLIDDIQMRHVHVPDWNASCRKFCVLPMSALTPAFVYCCSTLTKI